MNESIGLPDLSAQLTADPTAAADIVQAPRPDSAKVGLALAGGGFRASFFHLGVYRRLAELDVLRRVEVLSTVSGGSIIGALYTLLLRERWLRKDKTDGDPERLSRQDYLCIVEEMEKTLRRGIQKNLRNRLLWNPIVLARIGLTGYSFGTHMARIYERHLYADVVERLRTLIDFGDGVPQREGAFPLDQMRPVPHVYTKKVASEETGSASKRNVGRVDELPGGLEDYNRTQAADPRGCAVLHHVINATSVNSGGRFWFSSSEVGDWYLGYARGSEADELQRLKALREAVLGRGPDDLDHVVERLADRGVKATLHEAQIALWVARVEAAIAKGKRTGRVLDERETKPGDWWPAVARKPGATSFVTALLGQLRRAKLPAWYLQVGSMEKDPPVWGIYRNPERTRLLFRGALREMDPRLAVLVDPTSIKAKDPDKRREEEHRREKLEDDLMDLARLVYGLRSAAALSRDVARDLSRLTIGDAVGASACFPPVFSPFMVSGIYDDAHVQTLGLTDGGVFDNAGITGLLDEQCACIIASDTGGVFETESVAKADHLSLVQRLSLILQANLGSIQRNFVRERRRFNRDLERVEEKVKRVEEKVKRVEEEVAQNAKTAGVARDALTQLRGARDSRPLRGLAYFHIESDPPNPTRGGENKRPGALSLTAAPHLLARIRTDLDAFGDAEINALANHGYALADSYVRTYLADFEADWKPWCVPLQDPDHPPTWEPSHGWDAAEPKYPWPQPAAHKQQDDPASEQHNILASEQQRDLARALRVGGRRFFRSVQILKPISIVPALVTVSLLGLMAWLAPDIACVVGAADAWLQSLGTLQESLGWSWPWPLGIRLSVATALPLALLGRAYWTHHVKPELSERKARASGKVANVLPRLLAFGTIGLLLMVWPGLRIWVVGWASLVFILPAVGVLDRLAFTWPFLRATRAIGRAEAEPLDGPRSPSASP
ncbi:MAG: patatin-like phospholipase family protein [Bacteroidota bacterium]